MVEKREFMASCVLCVVRMGGSNIYFPCNIESVAVWGNGAERPRLVQRDPVLVSQRRSAGSSGVNVLRLTIFSSVSRGNRTLEFAVLGVSAKRQGTIRL